MEAHPKRTLIFQILKIIIAAVIAVALVKFAFFPNQEKAPPVVAQGKFTNPTVSAYTADIDNTLKLDARVLRDESRPVKATESGKVTHFYVNSGAEVSEGQNILQLTQTNVEQVEVEVPVPGDPDDPYAALGSTTQLQERTTEKYINIKAPAAGKLNLDVLQGQEVQLGEVIGQIVPATFHAEVSITPDQLYGLEQLPGEATVAIKDGPAPFTCTGLQTITASAGSSSGVPGLGPTQGGSGKEATGSSPQLRCAIPAEQQVYDGISAKLEIAGQNATGVLVVPVSAVEGRYREGVVYIPGPEGKKPEKRTVGLGITDGKIIQITSGLEEGEEILQFVPSVEENERPQGPMF
ncbi:efflux RND transporter periplasmic adaptor subunit [Actinobaculum suis]|uniref:efflux RND transporter periplasmic adaptor subunit n=1 Tax=Actinobaculum suis TaxID=1657 RepID=UPI00080870BB|nr:efflux RND transporter periplasmic adaptor subunit [Actinobaculum suis]OCA94584.1 hypothetical protein ACU20_06450 [Actinobaculum suis]OCA94995.1 hypothetical protein ACU21_05235 [Actinobaculum suis]